MQSLTSDTNTTTENWTRLILIRHAAVEQPTDNYRMFGWTDVELSELGRQQAAAVAVRLEELAATAPIYTSPLARARATAEAISGGRQIRQVSALKEINCGEVDGWTVQEVQNEFPSLWKANFRQENDAFCWPGGETYRRFRTRILRGPRAIAAMHRGDSAIVVTHSGVISQFLGFIHELPPARWGDYRPGHASISIVATDGVAGRLIRFDDRTHLEPAQSP